MASVGRVDTRFEAGLTGVRDTQGDAHIGGGQARDAGGPCLDLGIVDIGDAIITVEGIPIKNEGDLFPSIESLEPGDTVTVAGGPTGGQGWRRWESRDKA